MVSAIKHGLSTAPRTAYPTHWHWLKYHQYLVPGEAEIRSLADYVPRTKAAVDVGVHLGFYSRRLSGLAASVYSFEPNPESFSQAQVYLGARTDLRQVALSDDDGLIGLRIPLSGAHGGEPALSTCSDTNDLGGLPFRTVTVAQRRLDSFDLPPVGFIKIDVEGHEEAVLEGARGVIARDAPNLMIEIEERHNPGGFRRICEKLARDGYAAHYLLAGTRVPVTGAEDLASLVPATGVYVNNFLFQRC